MITYPALASAATAEAARHERASPPSADLPYWRIIAQLLEQGEVATEVEWPAIVATASGAAERLLVAARAAQDPASPHHALAAAREARLGNLFDIRRTLERNAWRQGHCLSDNA